MRSSTPGPRRSRSTSTPTPAWRPPTAPAPRGCRSAMLRGYIGTDLPAVNPRIRSVDCPFTGERLAAVPALNPDVTILHAQRADRRGNVALHGIVGRPARGGARRARADRHGRGNRRRTAARDEWHRAAALGRERRGAVSGRRLSVVRAWPLRAGQRFLPGLGRDRARTRRLHGLDGPARAREPRPRRVPRQPAGRPHERLDAATR